MLLCAGAGRSSMPDDMFYHPHKFRFSYLELALNYQPVK